MDNKLTEEQINSIKNYADDIETIDSFMQAIRQMPGMYIGHIGNKGFINMFREIFQNIIDEIFRVNSPCNMAKITFEESTCTSILEDNGRGIPFNNIIRTFTSEHTSSNYKKKPGQYSSGMHGLGSKCTNALSSKFIVESYILGDARRVEFTDGEPWDKGEVIIPNKENRQGTIITFIPSFEILGAITVTVEELLQFLQMMLPLTPIGTKFYFNGIKADGTNVQTILTNEDGIMTYLIDSCKNPMIKPIMFSQDTGYFKADVIIEYDTDVSVVPEHIVSFCNFCPTDTKESDHVTGFLSGLRKYFVNYMNKVYLANNSGKKRKKPLRVIESDVRTGLRVAIVGACLEPLFTGQAKEILSVAEMKTFMEELTYNSLTEWGKANPNELAKMCKYFKEIAEIRSSTDEKKVKLSNQYASTVAGLPSKFIKPTKKWEEFFIVEGDSAKGSFNTHRHNPTQGVFPIRGMILNCFEISETRALSNPEVAGILAIIGGGYGKNFDISKVRWNKVIACFTGDTRVRTLNKHTDGMTFEQLTVYSATHPNEQIWVYSYDLNTNQYVPALATNIGVRQWANKIARVTLDDGGVIHSTIDHLYLTRDRGYVEAQNLMSGESLVPLYTRTNRDQREEIYLNTRWEQTFHWSKNSTSFINWNSHSGMVIHHIDGDKMNDNPNNLISLTKLDHDRGHMRQHNISEAHRQRISELHKQGVYDPAANIAKATGYASLADYNRSEEHKQKIREAYARGSYDENLKAMWKGAREYQASDEFKNHMKEMNADPQIKLNQIRGRLCKYGKCYILDGYNLTEETLSDKEIREKIIDSYGRCILLQSIEKAFDSFDQFALMSAQYPLTEEEHNAAKIGRKSKEEIEQNRLNCGRAQISRVIRAILDNGLDVTEENYISYKREVSKKAPVWKNIVPRYFDSMEDAIEAGKNYNHKVVSVEILGTWAPVPMYCLTVQGYGNFAICDGTYNPTTTNLNSIIVHNCSDADAAGYQIEALLLRLVLRFCPQLILAGKYYKSVAPLYYITVGKGKSKKKIYFTNRVELVEYVQRQFSKSNVITTMDDRKLSTSQVQELLYNNIDYIYYLEKIANRYRISPDILEIYLNNRDKKPEDICKAIKKKYRFMDSIIIDGITVCDGIANGVSNTLILNDKMINDCIDIIKIIDGNLYTMYKVNGAPSTLLDIMTAYTKFQPTGLTRLKGLGEQSGEELAESVILPGDMGNRTLLQYTMSSAMKEIEEIRRYESNKNLLLEGLIVNRLDISD